MSMGKLNKEALDEVYVYWYYKVYKKLPKAKPVHTKANTIKLIWILKRKYYKIMKQDQVETYQ